MSNRHRSKGQQQSSLHRQLLSGTALGVALLTLTQTAAAITLDDSQRKRIDALFEEFTSSTPGCALGIMSEGNIVYARGYGMATLDPPAAIDETKLFDIASISKQFMGGLIVLLEQQGKLKFTDDVRKYVPELPNYGAPITINNLLWHTSGLRDYSVLLLLGGFDYPDVTTQAQALEVISKQRRLNFAPGSRYEYSNTGYVLLAIIAERVSRKTINQLARQQVFNPLGMPLAVFRDKFDLVIPNQALGYVPVSDTEFAISMSNWEQVGDGALQTSIEEIHRWDENFYSGQVGGADFIAEMHHTGRLNNGRPLIYARGLQVDRYRGLRRARHGGDWIGYHSDMQRFPDLHTTVALMCNSDGIFQYALSEGVIDIALEKQFTEPKPPLPTPAPSLPFERFVGSYFNDVHKEAYAVTIDEDGALTLNYHYLPLTLTSTGPTTFTIDGLPGSTLQFAVQGSSPARAMTFDFYADEPDDDPRRATRFTPVTPPADLNQYAGTFFSPELNVTWKLVVEEGSLTLAEDPEQIVIPFTGPLAPANTADSFFGGPGLLQFTRNSSGAVTGFRMSFIGMTDFRFERRSAATLTQSVPGSDRGAAAPTAGTRSLPIQRRR